MTRAHPSIVVPADAHKSDGTFFLPDYWYWEEARRAGISVAQMLGPEFVRSAIAIDNSAQAGDLAYSLGGRAVKPRNEVVLVGPDGKTPIVIAGMGVTEAAELEDIALAAYDKRQRLLDQGKPMVDFDELRERGGYAPRAQLQPMIRDALLAKVEHHKRHVVTDPGTKRKEKRLY